MTDLPDPDTDPTPSEGGYGFLGRIIGLPILEQVILARLEQLIGTNEADKQALMEALTESRSTDVRVDAIQPDQSKKGTKP